MQWFLIGELLGAVARATNRPGIDEAIPRWLDMIQVFIKRGDVAATELNALKTHIQSMVIADRNPTDEEWAALEKRSDEAHATIQNAVIEDDPEPEPEPEPEPVDPEPVDPAPIG